MLALALFAMTVHSAASQSTFYVGTYTGAGGGKGIYRVRLDTMTGELSKPELAAEAVAPSYLCIRPDGKALYAVNEYSDGEVSAYAIEQGGLRKLNTVRFEAKGLCHIAVDSKGRWLLASAYGGGALVVLPILADGSVGSPSDTFKNIGSGPNLKRQEAPHLHYAEFVGKQVYACDLGTDEVLIFEFDSVTGRLTPASPRAGRTEPGAGPRHFAVSKDGKHVYTSNEMGIGVSVFGRNPDSGTLRLVQTQPTIESFGVNPNWSTAAVKLHPRLQALYVSTRGEDSITQFEIVRDGTIVLRSSCSLDVSEPRDFAIDPSGRWIVVGGQKSGEIETLRVDAKSGELTTTPHRARIPKPVCIIFAP